MTLSNVEWRRATRSTVQNDNCIEVASARNFIAVRDSKNPTGPKIILSRQGFRRLTEALKNT
ncbi:DUF397 domain-containing protein [Actinomadura sp. SCN-SB]|uniref:DUF397 domain-containing protein n=1 Tax=Actinomadura sp. SCN-SB TaxID=3373092 RepID=UPI003751A15D